MLRAGPLWGETSDFQIFRIFINVSGSHFENLYSYWRHSLSKYGLVVVDIYWVVVELGDTMPTCLILRRIR